MRVNLLQERKTRLESKYEYVPTEKLFVFWSICVLNYLFGFIYFFDDFIVLFYFLNGFLNLFGLCLSKQLADSLRYLLIRCRYDGIVDILVLEFLPIFVLKKVKY